MIESAAYDIIKHDGMTTEAREMLLEIMNAWFQDVPGGEKVRDLSFVVDQGVCDELGPCHAGCFDDFVIHDVVFEIAQARGRFRRR